MSGVSSVGSGIDTSLLSSVGASLATTGQAPVAATPSGTAAATTAPAKAPLSAYQSEFLTLQQQDTAELLYASFLTPQQSLENGNAVLQQAANLLGTPGSQPVASPSGGQTSGLSNGTTTASTGITPIDFQA